MKKTLALTLLMLLVIFNLSAVAQDDDDEIEKDKAELTFFGGFGIPSGDLSNWGDSLNPSSGNNIGLEGGFFFTTNITAGFNFTYTSFGIDSNDELVKNLTHRLYSPSLYVKYYLPTESNFVPYLKGVVGLDFARFTTSVPNVNGSRYRQVSYDPALAYGIGIGAFYYTADYSGFFVEANYRISKTEDVKYLDVATFGVNATTIDIHAGFRVLIGSDE